MKLSDVLNISMAEASKLSRADLAKIVRAGASPLNKRIKNIHVHRALISPATAGLGMTGGAHFGVKGKTRNELLNELYRMQSFAKKSTATVAGAKKFTKHVMETAGATKGTDENRFTRAKRYWDVYNRVVDEMGLELVKSYGSEQIQADIRQIHDLESMDIMEYVMDIYESIGETYADRSAVSDFFTPLE